MNMSYVGNFDILNDNTENKLSEKGFSSQIRPKPINIT